MRKKPELKIVSDYSGPPRCVIYARVSSDDQVDKDLSIPAQISECTIHANARGWVIVRVLTDPGISGMIEHRPGLDTARAMAREGNYDILLFHKYDRFSRDDLHPLLIERELKASQVSIRSVMEPFVGGSLPYEKNMTAFSRMQATNFIDNLKIEIRKGQKQRISMGQQLGQAPFGYGYRNLMFGGSGWVPDEADAVWVKYMFARLLEGATCSQIARELNEKSVPTYYGRARGRKLKVKGASYWRSVQVWRILQSRAYIGEINHHDEWMPGIHEPIIDRAVFDRVQRIMERRPRGRSDNSPHGLFVGDMMHCPLCGSAMTHTAWKHNGTAYSRYMCRSSIRRKKAAIYHVEMEGCAGYTIGQTQAVKLLQTELTSIFGDGARRQKDAIGRIFAKPRLRDIDGERRQILSQLEALETAETNYQRQHAFGLATDAQLLSNIESVRMQRESLRKSLAGLESNVVVLPTQLSSRQARDLLDMLQSGLSVPEKRDALRQYIQCVIPTPDKSRMVLIIRP